MSISGQLSRGSIAAGCAATGGGGGGGGGGVEGVAGTSALNCCRPLADPWMKSVADWYCDGFEVIVAGWLVVSAVCSAPVAADDDD